MDKTPWFGFNRAEMRCLCLLAVVLVSGCAGFELNSTDPNAVASGVTRTSDPYTQVTKISADLSRWFLISQTRQQLT